MHWKFHEDMMLMHIQSLRKRNENIRCNVNGDGGYHPLTAMEQEKALSRAAINPLSSPPRRVEFVGQAAAASSVTMEVWLHGVAEQQPLAAASSCVPSIPQSSRPNSPSPTMSMAVSFALTLSLLRSSAGSISAHNKRQADLLEEEVIQRSSTSTSTSLAP